MLGLLVFYVQVSIKGTLLSLSQYLANESSLKIMENAFYFTLKALFVLKIFKFPLLVIQNFAMN